MTEGIGSIQDRREKMRIGIPIKDRRGETTVSNEWSIREALKGIEDKRS